jgi:hypothetical protein
LVDSLPDVSRLATFFWPLRGEVLFLPLLRGNLSIPTVVAAAGYVWLPACRRYRGKNSFLTCALELRIEGSRSITHRR